MVATFRCFGVRQLAAAFLQPCLLGATEMDASKLARQKAAASCRTPNVATSLMANETKTQ